MNESVFLKFCSLKDHSHICHLYYNDTERLEIATNFVIHGTKNKEICLYISDGVLPKELEERLIGSGVDIDQARKKKYFDEIIVLGKQKEEIKNPNSFIRFFNHKIEAVLRGKRKLVRILMSNKDVFFYSNAGLLWEKALLDKMCSEKPVILVDQYEIGKINSKDLINLFVTHPEIILKNLAYDSPFYTPSDEILSQLQEEPTYNEILTSKEKRILRYIVNGYSSSGIARELFISARTVQTHRANIMRKLDIHKVIDLVKFAMKNGIT